MGARQTSKAAESHALGLVFRGQVGFGGARRI